MKKGVRIVLFWALGIFTVLLFTFWLVFESSPFSKHRIEFVERILTEEFGYEIRIDGDIQIQIFPKPTLYVHSATLPGFDSLKTDLAVLKTAQLHFRWKDLLRGDVNVLALSVEDLNVTLLKNEDRTANWESLGFSSAPSRSEEVVGLVPILLNRVVDFKNIRLSVNDKVSGFVFNFRLDDLTIDQTNNNTSVTLASQGSVNGELFQSSGQFKRAGAFRMQTTVAETVFSYSGTTTAQNFESFTGAINVQIGEIGTFLETLRLARAFEGTANLDGTFARENGIVSLKELDFLADFRDGRTIRAVGDIGDLPNMTDMQVVIDADLIATDADIRPAERFRDLKLETFFARIIGVNKEISLEDIQIGTNSGHRDFQEIGPVTVGRVKRTSDGRLRLEDLALELGDGDTPFLRARGHINDLLEFSDYEAKGDLVLEASKVFSFIPENIGEKFGIARAEFEVNDAGGHPSLTRFDLETEGTDLWSLKAVSEIGDIGSLDEANFDFDFHVADGVAFLTTLGLEPIAVNDIAITGALERFDKVVDLEFSVAAGETNLKLDLDAQRNTGRPVFSGAITSAQVRTKDLQDAVAVVVAMSTLNDDPLAEYKPLVLPPPEEPEYQPLVLDPSSDELEFKNLLDWEDRLQETDLTITIQIAKLVGQAGVSGLNSDLAVLGGKLRFGPIHARLGGGQFSFGANMDLINSPKIIGVSGSTSGWDFGELLKTVGVDIAANGTLNARFNLAGRRDSVEAFLDSMGGTANVYMSNGTIATSLLDLSGLGVLKWLFSKELHAGRTTIACVSAPMKISRGKISTDEAVIDTRQVQIVLDGYVDFVSETMKLRGVPRPIGKPLARSPFPFAISGNLTKPDVQKTKVGRRTTKEPVKMPAKRKPCVADVSQLVRVP